MRENMWHLSFYDWYNTLMIICSRIHFPANNIPPFFWKKKFHCVYLPQFPYLSLCCWTPRLVPQWLLWTEHLSKLVRQVSLDMLTWGLFGKYPGISQLGSWVTGDLLLFLCRPDFHIGWTSLHSHQPCECSLLSASSPAIVPICFLNVCKSGWSEKGTSM